MEEKDFRHLSWLIRVLVREAYYILKDRSMIGWDASHVLENRFLGHKKKEHAANGTEYVIPRCNPDRPAVVPKQESVVPDLEPRSGQAHHTEDLIHG